MSIEGATALGDWETRPRRVNVRPVDELGLTPEEAIILRRVDGIRTIELLCASSGFGRNETLGLLFSLLGRDLIAVGPEGEGTGPLPSGALESRPHLEVLPFRGVDPQDVRFLQAYGPIGYVPGLPLAEPGRGRYGRYQFDRRALLIRCGLTVEERREVVFLSQNLPRLDHFEFYGIEPTVDRREIKKAYFELSKRYHPDARRQKDMGAFEPLVQAVYRHATDVNELLQRDEPFRITYARAVMARNAAYRGDLESLREEQFQRQHQARLGVAAERKEALRERLDRNQVARRTQSAGPDTARLRQSERFFAEAQTELAAGRRAGALNLLRLAHNYDPRNLQVGQALEKLDAEVRRERAARLWTQGELEEQVDRLDEMLAAYLAAIEAEPTVARCLHAAGVLFKRTRKYQTAIELAERAVAMEPQNVDALLLLAAIYERADLSEKARATLERAERIAPKSAAVQQAISELRSAPRKQ